MMSITTKPLHFEEELKKKIEFVCSFCNTTPEIINGNIRNIDLTNITYIEPHRIIIKGVTLLAFNYYFHRRTLCIISHFSFVCQVLFSKLFK